VRSEKEIRALLASLRGKRGGLPNTGQGILKVAIALLEEVLDGPPQTERVVTGCMDCPYAANSLGACRLSAGGTRIHMDMGEGSTPDWCPLREGPIVLRLAE
jgi:hypothetical protein